MARQPLPPQPPQPQPQFSNNEPRRTQRLEPSAREEMPDPFEHSSRESSDDPLLPPSPEIGRSMQDSHSRTEDLPSVNLEQHFGEDEGEESQLFPGSDLF